MLASLRKEVLLLIARNKDLLNCLLLINDSPTRINEVSSTAIDLLFVNNNLKHLIVSSGVLSVHISDDSLLYCVVKSGVTKCPGRTNQYTSYKLTLKKHF